MEQSELISSVIRVVIAVAIILYILYAIGLYKVFEKAGVEGWKALIPIYSTVVVLKIVGKPWWWVFLISISFSGYLKDTVGPTASIIAWIGVIWSVWKDNMLAKSFGKSAWFTVGLVLFPYIFYMILGFNDDKYLGPYGDPEAFRAFNEKKDFDFENNIFNH